MRHDRGGARCRRPTGGSFVSTIPPRLPRGCADRPSPPTCRGDLHLAESGLVAQVVLDPDAVGGVTSTGRRAPRIEVLPASVRPEELGAEARESSPPGVEEFLVGLASADLSRPASVYRSVTTSSSAGWHDTGRTTALRGARRGLARTASERRGGVDRSTNGARRHRRVASRDDLDVTPRLLVVDDADRVTDPTGVLADVVAGRHPGVTIVASARLEAARPPTGTGSRRGTVSLRALLTAAGRDRRRTARHGAPPSDADAHRPGLAWMIDGRGHQLVQVADRMPA